MALTKQDLIDQVALKNDLSKRAAKDVIDQLYSIMAAELTAGEDFVLSGIGRLSVVQRAARKGRNPQTGETMKIAARKVVRFTTHAALKTAVNAKKRASKKKA